MTPSSLQQHAIPKSIFDVASLATLPPPRQPHTAALHRIFHITSGRACATVGPLLGTKFGLERDNKQLVVSVSNKWTLEQVWWNEARTKKPQTFSSQVGTQSQRVTVCSYLDTMVIVAVGWVIDCFDRCH